MGKKTGDKDAKTGQALAAAYGEVAPHLVRMGARHALDGEDIGQDAMVRVLQVKDRSAIEDPVRYLFRVARNLFVDAERARGRERALMDSEADLESKADVKPDAERTLVGKQRLEQALKVIEDLPPRCRQAFRLHRFEGLSYAAIAREMGVSPSMVEKHIAEAMLRLGRALGRDDE
ncbi:MAG TPA: RNA polymerase sigma factor [Alphaproteobacteria bacterium]|nr:RNA polymerase sigma factor [Alphaproteobacteria bacterium]